MKSDDELLHYLTVLGFRLSADDLHSFFEDAGKKKLSPRDLFLQLAALELRERDLRNLASRTRKATLGKFTLLDRFDWSHPKKVKRDLYERLLLMDFIRGAENALFRGPSGIGKTTLAQNLGLEALKKGHTVKFVTLAAALADLSRQESLPAFERRLKRYTLPSLLILDEIGFLPCDGRSADILYNIVSRRHEERSTIITTNLSFKQWPTIFPGAACVGALVDRFTQHCHVVDIEATSYRQRNGPPPEHSSLRSSPRKRRGRRRR